MIQGRLTLRTLAIV